ncbi:hypothetical protein [Streptomyces sp. SLBN-31]|uniref:hypothetical protein n=1 Tax=unclassified Streptomyces TaxID=2593676 RepID=UPI001174A3EC|nr:hypothetical protein [Streptomyces sp. SLBN-31]TQJ91538.1 hypothetical protein FBY22_2365 [Streptomyces sp. SLBN-31]
MLTDLDDRRGERLGPDEVTAYRKAVETASAPLVRELRDRSATAGVRAADPISDALAQIQTAISDLLKALGSLDLGSALDSVTGALSPVLSLVTGLLGGGLPSLPAAE